MKIAIFADNISWRGVGVITHTQIELLAKRGIDILLIMKRIHYSIKSGVMSLFFMERRMQNIWGRLNSIVGVMVRLDRNIVFNSIL